MIEKAWDWDNVNNNYWEIPDEYMYFLVDKWRNREGNKVLDLGCGIGRHSKLFAQNHFDVTALDISESAINEVNNIAKENNLNVKTILSNIVELPLEEKQFDGIIAFNSVYHTDTNGFYKVISEIKRVLKNEGEAFITLLSKEDPSFEKASNKTVDENTRMKMEEDGTELPHFFVGYEDIFRLFKDFEIISVKQVAEYFNTKKHIHFNVLLRLRGGNGSESN